MRGSKHQIPLSRKLNNKPGQTFRSLKFSCCGGCEKVRRCDFLNDIKTGQVIVKPRQGWERLQGLDRQEIGAG